MRVTLFDENQLIAKSMAGNKNAFGQLVNIYQSPVRFLLRRMCKDNDALADDIAQEAFIRAFDKIKCFRGDAKFSTWISRIAINEFLQFTRKQKRRLELEQNLPSMESEPRNAGQTIDMKLAIEKAMDQLKPEESTAIRLNMMVGHSHPEVSELMQLPLGTVKSHINRGRQKLTDLLKSHRPEYAPKEGATP